MSLSVFYSSSVRTRHPQPAIYLYRTCNQHLQPLSYADIVFDGPAPPVGASGWLGQGGANGKGGVLRDEEEGGGVDGDGEAANGGDGGGGGVVGWDGTAVSGRGGRGGRGQPSQRLPLCDPALSMRPVRVRKVRRVRVHEGRGGGGVVLVWALVGAQTAPLHKDLGPKNVWQKQMKLNLTRT